MTLDHPMTLILPAILSTKDCHELCGGRPIFEELAAAFPDTLRPVRTTPRGDSYYRRETVENVILQAELTGKLLSRPEPVAIPVLTKQGTRLRRTSFTRPQS
jgi:hypothetical protein